MKKILETERLFLREFHTNDVNFILDLVNSPSWIQFIGDRNIRTEEAAKLYIENSLQKSYAQHGYGLWLMQLKETSKAIGMCGLVNRASLEDIDIGFALLPAYEKKGYALEAAQATMNYANSDLNIAKIVAITDKNNVGSKKLLNKIGLHFEKELKLSENDIVLLFS